MDPENDDERPAPANEAGTAAAPEAEARSRPADVQTYIGRQLRAVYDDVVKQPIPDRFLELMKQLEEQSIKG